MKKLFLTYLFCNTIFNISSQKIYFVSPIGSSANKGLSWITSFNNPNQALTIAQNGDQIWVAAGTYYTSETNDVDSSFRIPSGVSLLGGFKGNETNITQRNHIENKTILSGNIGNKTDSTDNSYNVVKIINTKEEALIDGFIIQDGHSTTVGYDSYLARKKYNGAGVFIYNTEFAKGTKARVVRCMFQNLYSKFNGAAIYARDDFGERLEVNIEECIFNIKSINNNYYNTTHSVVSIVNLKPAKTYNFSNNHFKGDPTRNGKPNSNNTFVFGLLLEKSDSIVFNIRENTWSDIAINYGIFGIVPGKNQEYKIQKNLIKNGSTYFSINGYGKNNYFLEDNIFSNTSTSWPIIQDGYVNINENYIYSGAKVFINNNLFKDNKGTSFFINLPCEFRGNVFCGNVGYAFLTGKINLENNLIYKNINFGFRYHLGLIRKFNMENNTFLGNDSLVLDHYFHDINFKNQSTWYLQNNIFSANKNVFFDSTEEASFINNLFDDETQKKLFLKGGDYVLDSNNILGFPIFSDTTNCNAQLSPCSPGVDAGMIYDGMSDTDIVGNPRVNNIIDIGAYESTIDKTDDVTTINMLDYLFTDSVKLDVAYNQEFKNITWSPSENLSCSNCYQPSLLSAKDEKYFFKGIDSYGCLQEDSIEVSFIAIKENKYGLPNAVALKSTLPENQSFYVKDPSIVYNLDIYDRWGNKLFSKNNLIGGNLSDGWLPNESNVQTGVYLYKLTLKKDKKITVSFGTVTVL